MTAWAVLIPADRDEAERLFHHDTLELAGLEQPPGCAPGDEVLVVRDTHRPAVVVALGQVTETGAADGPDPDDPQATDGSPRLVVRYTRRSFDEPVPAPGLRLAGPVTPVGEATYRELAARVAPAAGRTSWLVSLGLPIEASSPAEAVRLFWSYVRELGPRELPAYVSPAGDELAMQAYVLGAEANQDPEEDD